MTDNELIAIVAGRLAAASAAAGWDYDVIQKDQPTQQGIPYAPTIFFERLFDHEYGHPMVNYLYNPPQAPATQGTYDEVEEQIVQTTFQISALVIQDPEDLSIPTAADVVQYMKAYLTARPTIQFYKSQNCSILRVSEIRHPWNQDERHRFEGAPNFDIIFNYRRAIKFVVPATDIVEGAIVSGIAGAGVFPVPDDPYGDAQAV